MCTLPLESTHAALPVPPGPAAPGRVSSRQELSASDRMDAMEGYVLPAVVGTALLVDCLRVLKALHQPVGLAPERQDLLRTLLNEACPTWADPLLSNDREDAEKNLSWLAATLFRLVAEGRLQ